MRRSNARFFLKKRISSIQVSLIARDLQTADSRALAEQMEYTATSTKRSSQGVTQERSRKEHFKGVEISSSHMASSSSSSTETDQTYASVPVAAFPANVRHIKE